MPGPPSPTIDWHRLLEEFEDFEPDADDCRFECDGFVASLTRPEPEFLAAFIDRKLGRGLTQAEAVRALYCYLLQKRYDEKLNLLHFAFHIFDEGTCLPQEMIDRTPFPHEDGVPGFRHSNNPHFKLKP